MPFSKGYTGLPVFMKLILSLSHQLLIKVGAFKNCADFSNNFEQTQLSKVLREEIGGKAAERTNCAKHSSIEQMSGVHLPFAERKPLRKTGQKNVYA